jgi:NitT/TauT family transport system substrate-binding protein
MIHRVAMLVVFLLLGAAAPAPTAEKLNAYMNWTLHGQHGPWFVAKARGYFSQAGIEMNIQRGYGSADTVKKVLTGVADVGLADPLPIIIAVAEGQPVKAFMGGFMVEPCVLHSAAEHGNVRGPKDMEGKSMGGPPADVCITLLRAVMEKAGADFSKVRVENMDAPTRIPMLAAGRIDAAADFIGSEILWEKALRAGGKRRVGFRYDQFIEKYGLMAVVGEKTIKEKPEVVRGITLALLRGFQDHLKDPEMAANTILQAHPELDRDYVHSSARALLDIVWDETTRAKGIGILNSAKMRSTIEISAKYWKLPRKPAPEEVFTNQYIEWAHAQPQGQR